MQSHHVLYFCPDIVGLYYEPKYVHVYRFGGEYVKIKLSAKRMKQASYQLQVAYYVSRDS